MLRLDRPEVLAWWQLAQTDLRVAQVVAVIDPPAWHVVCFLAQQAGEKCLKAVLEARQWTIPRTHDLTVLVDLVAADLAPERIVDDAICLSDYGVKPRYPVPAFEATGQQANAAIAAAERIAAWAELALTSGVGD